MGEDLMLQQLISGEHVVVTPISTEYSTRPRTELLLSLYFWEALLHDKVLLFDERAVFCAGSPWANFSSWDFIMTQSVSLRLRNPSIVMIERGLTQLQTEAKSQTRQHFIPDVADERLWFLEQFRSNPMNLKFAPDYVHMQWLGSSDKMSQKPFAVLRDVLPRPRDLCAAS
jgi:hypothetical protein